MFKRIHRLWELSKKDPEVLDRYSQFTSEELADIPDKGDGKAVFFGEGSQEEFVEQERKDKGLGGWYRRLRNLD